VIIAVHMSGKVKAVTKKPCKAFVQCAMLPRYHAEFHHSR